MGASEQDQSQYMDNNFIMMNEIENERHNLPLMFSDATIKTPSS